MPQGPSTGAVGSRHLPGIRAIEAVGEDGRQPVRVPGGRRVEGGKYRTRPAILKGCGRKAPRRRSSGYAKTASRENRIERVQVVAAVRHRVGDQHGIPGVNHGRLDGRVTEGVEEQLLRHPRSKGGMDVPRRGRPDFTVPVHLGAEHGPDTRGERAHSCSRNPHKWPDAHCTGPNECPVDCRSHTHRPPDR